MPDGINSGQASGQNIFFGVYDGAVDGTPGQSVAPSSIHAGFFLRFEDYTPNIKISWASSSGNFTQIDTGITYVKNEIVCLETISDGTTYTFNIYGPTYSSLYSYSITSGILPDKSDYNFGFRAEIWNQAVEAFARQMSGHLFYLGIP